MLLAPQDQETDELLRRALLTAGFSFARLGTLMIIADAQRHLTKLTAALIATLPEDIRTGIRAAYAPGNVDSYEQALFSFAAAEPLDQLLEKTAEHPVPLQTSATL